MQRFHIWIFAALFGLLSVTNPAVTKAQGGYYSASYQDFYDGLAPYGQWIQDPQYGYVWLPDVDQDFRPYYTNGYWANTEYGNTWISDYDWGWAPFHYGRWTFDNYYGWLWIPGTEWAPAWVSWRSTNDYYGWAPMGPGININVNLGLTPVDWWVFLSPNYFYERSFHRYCNNDYRFRRNIYSRSNYINYTYVNNRTSYYTGPRPNDYYATTGRRPSMYSITNNNRRGGTRISGSRITMYRPSITRSTNAAPARVVPTDRNITTRPQRFSGNAENAVGRDRVLRQNAIQNNNVAPGRNTLQNGTPERRLNNNVQNVERQGVVPVQQNGRNVQQLNPQDQQRVQQQQRDAQMQQQRAVQDQQRVQQQQRDAQMQQQRAVQDQQRVQQQQRDGQMQQQRAVQDQQRVQQQQRDAQMQQQRAAQEQQRAQQQQRDAQMQQQRAAQEQQQRAQQQQRDAQMQQQRAVQDQQRVQQQQRDAQMQQQRAVQEQQRAQQQQRDAQMQQQRAVQEQQQRMQQEQPRREAPAQREQVQPAQRQERAGGLGRGR